MGEKRDTSAIVFFAGEHDTLSAEAAVSANVLLLALDEADGITAEQHLLLSVTVLKELFT